MHTQYNKTKYTDYEYAQITTQTIHKNTQKYTKTHIKYTDYTRLKNTVKIQMI